MIGIVCSDSDEASSNMAERLISSHGFERTGAQDQQEYRSGQIGLYRIQSRLLNAEFVDSLNLSLVCFLSKHSSKSEVGAFTTHSLGNWDKEAKFGGKPQELSFAAPVAMLSLLVALSKTETSVEKTYEATHHGPLVKTPAIFVEIGGNEDVIRNKANADTVADVVYVAITKNMNNEAEYSKVVIGIGSTHYPRKFSQLAIERGYAFSHIMSKHSVRNEDGTYNLDVLEQTLTRTTHRPESAVIDWKSLNSDAKERVIKKLNEIGLDYEKS